MTSKSVVHRLDMNLYGQHLWPDGLVPWRDAVPPNLTGQQDGEITVGMLRACEYCGSMHPADVVAAIRANAQLEVANRKYGWPHKIYLDGVPNPHAGLLEARSSANFKSGDDWVQTGERHWREPGKPAPETTWGKFYTVHLMDATPDEKEAIEAAIGIRFWFTDDGKVRWESIKS